MLAGSCAKPARSGNAASTAATSNPNVTGARRAAALPPPGRRRGRMREREDDGDSADGGRCGGWCGGRTTAAGILLPPLHCPPGASSLGRQRWVVAAGPRPPLPPVRSPSRCRRPSTPPPTQRRLPSPVRHAAPLHRPAVTRVAVVLPRRRPGGGRAAARRTPVTSGVDVAAVLAAFPDLAGFARLPTGDRLQSHPAERLNASSHPKVRLNASSHPKM